MLRAAAGVNGVGLPGVDCAAAAETDTQNPAAVSNTMTRTPRAVAHLLLTGLMRCAPIVYQRATNTRRTDCHGERKRSRQLQPRQRVDGIDEHDAAMIGYSRGYSRVQARR